MTEIRELVTLRVVATCVGCGRKLDTSETLDGESLRTGNKTQMASYWLEDMKRRVKESANVRRWELLEDGYRCAHCTAAEVDKLGEGKVTPRLRDTCPHKTQLETEPPQCDDCGAVLHPEGA